MKNNFNKLMKIQYQDIPNSGADIPNSGAHSIINQVKNNTILFEI